MTKPFVIWKFNFSKKTDVRPGISTWQTHNFNEYNMTPQKSKLIFLLPVLILTLNELIRTFLRPIYGQKKYGFLSEVLGWLPNFLASLSFMSIAIVTIIIMQGSSDKPISRKHKILFLFASSALGLTGFLLHEMSQKGTGLTFDVGDIYATIAGIFLGAALFYFMLLNKKEE